MNAETFTRFYIRQENEPPVSADDRLATKGKYDQEIMFMFYGNTNTMNSHPIIYTKKKYKKLNITFMALYYEDKFLPFMSDAEFSLPEEIGDLGSNVSDGRF